jgi:hypothetical protein
VRFSFFLAGTLFLSAAAGAAPILSSGTPANGYNAPPTAALPSFGTLFNFDSLTPLSAFNSATYAAQGVNISSPDGLVVYPYSTQSGPNELFDNSANGSANISIKTFGSEEVGIGIADSDPVTVYLQALNASGTGFGTVFAVTLPTGGSNPGNGYFILSDSKYDIYGIKITQSVGNASLYSGLAIDDLQVASTPEPASMALLGAGAILIGILRPRRRA